VGRSHGAKRRPARALRSLPREFIHLETPDGRKITFLAVVPLYREETDYKLKAGSDALIDRLDKAGVTDIIDPQRPNVCRPGLGRFFGRGG